MWIRDTAEDIVLEHVGPNRDQRVAIPRGTRLVVDGIGLRKYSRRIVVHLPSSAMFSPSPRAIDHNPRLFPDPEVFKPERWYDAHDSDVTMFSVGTRNCKPLPILLSLHTHRSSF